MTTPAPGRLDRVVFSYTSSDIALTGSSLPASGEDAWETPLRGHVRVSHDRRPATSLWYWADESRAALLRRVRGPGLDRDSSGDWCQGLVGAPGDLTAWDALTLGQWPGWDDHASWHGRSLEHVDADAVHAAYDSAAGQLTYATAEPGSALVALVAAAVRDPWAPIPVVAPDLPPRTATALLWGLFECTRLLFDASAGDPVPPWTFSTFEVRYDSHVTRLPHVVFLHSTPEPPRGAQRVGAPIGLSAGAPDDPVTARAAELVSAYVTGGRTAVDDLLRKRNVPNQTTVAARRKTLLGVLEPAHPPAPPEPPREPPPGAMPPPPQPEPLQLVPSSPRPELPQDPELAGRSDLDLVRTLFRPRVKKAEVFAVLNEVDARKVAKTGERPELLRLLLRRDFAAGLLREHLSPGMVRRAISEIVRFALQPADLDDPQTATALDSWVGTPTSSRTAVRVVLNYVADIDGLSLLLHGAGRRYFHEAGLEVAERVNVGAAGTSPALGRLTAVRHWYAAQPTPAKISVATLVALTVLEFMLLVL